MDRLTKLYSDGVYAYISESCYPCNECFGKGESECDECFQTRVINRLAAYENTGFEPSEVVELSAMRDRNNVKDNPLCIGTVKYVDVINMERELAAYRTAEEQRNKGCDFCNGHEHYHFYAGYSQQLDIVDKFVEREIEEINFCPICGRALKGGE